MLICGIANPRGEEDFYNGLHLKDSEIEEIVSDRTMVGVPVKIEHKGIGIGRVISAFKDSEGCLNCVMEIEDKEIEGAIAQEWIRDNTASELSLGYVVDINQSQPTSRLSAGRKKVLEVSIVRKGARQGCHIYSHKQQPRELLPNPDTTAKEVMKDWNEAFGI